MALAFDERDARGSESHLHPRPHKTRDEQSCFRLWHGLRGIACAQPGLINRYPMSLCIIQEHWAVAASGNDAPRRSFDFQAVLIQQGFTTQAPQAVLAEHHVGSSIRGIEHRRRSGTFRQLAAGGFATLAVARHRHDWLSSEFELDLAACTIQFVDLRSGVFHAR